MSYKIDKNVPVPAELRGRKAKYPFKEMEVGDSFFIPKTETARTTLYNASATPRLVKLGFKFTMQTKTENGVEGFRVWRVK